MNSRFLTVLIFLTFFLFSGNAFAYYLDTPHNESHGIDTCTFCHGHPNFNDGQDPNDPDITGHNKVCLNCHGGKPADINSPIRYVEGPVKKLHASSVTSGISGTEPGVWSTECIDCHDPHFQPQLDWSVSDGSKLYLAYGDFISDPIPNQFQNITTITFNGPVGAKPGFEDTSTWSAKGGLPGHTYADPTTATDGSRGLVLVTSIANPTETYEIIDVSGNVMTVRGVMTGSLQGLTFGVIYGQSIRSLLDDVKYSSNGNGSKNIKFFQPENISGRYGGYGDETPLETTPVGICQVCHNNTFYWKTDGTKRNHSFYRTCSACHLPQGGFKPFVHPFMSTTGACDTCHLGQVTPFVSPEGFYHEPSDTTILSPGEVHSLNGCFNCHDPATNDLQGSALNHTPDTLSDCMTCHGALKHETNHTNINYDPNLDISQVFSQQVECVGCHNAWTEDNTSLDTWQGMLTEHDSRDSVFDGIGGCATCHDYDGNNGNYNKEDPAIITTTLASGGAPVRCGTCHVNDVIFPP